MPENVFHKCMILRVWLKLSKNCALEKSCSASLPSGERVKDSSCHFRYHIEDEEESIKNSIIIKLIQAACYFSS